METHFSLSINCRAIACLLFLVLTVTCATSARILDEDAPPVPVVAPKAPSPAEAPLPDEVVPPRPAAAAPKASNPVETPDAANSVETLLPDEEVPLGPAAAAPKASNPVETPDAVNSVETPVAAPVAMQPNAGTGATVSAQLAKPDPHHPLSFFMHDMLGGSNPSARAVTGIVTNPAVNGQVPFARPNGAVLPFNNGVPINNNNNNGIINNNIPFLNGLGGSTSTVMQNNGNNNNLINGGGGVPLVNGGQLPAGTTLQKLMFGTMTVIDDELTEGHELGSGLIGKAQGFYVTSSEDGSSQTMAFTAMFDSSNYADTVSFFGVHRVAVSESQLAIMGGTGKYVNAKGYATVKAIPSVGHTTDGVETLVQVTVYYS